MQQGRPLSPQRRRPDAQVSDGAFSTFGPVLADPSAARPLSPVQAAVPRLSPCRTCGCSAHSTAPGTARSAPARPRLRRRRASRSRAPRWKERSTVRSCCSTAASPRRTMWLWGPSHPPGKELLAARVGGVAGGAEVGGAEEGHAVAHLRWHVEETWGTRSPGRGSRGIMLANPTL